MKRTGKYERVFWEKRAGGSAVFSRFIFVVAFSQFRWADYLGAWKRPGGPTSSQAKPQPHAK